MTTTCFVAVGPVAGACILVLGVNCGGTVASTPDASLPDATDVDATPVVDSTTFSEDVAPVSDTFLVSEDAVATESEARVDASIESSVETGGQDSPIDAAEVPDVGPDAPVLTIGNGLTTDPTCSSMPPGGFGYEAGTKECFDVSTDAGPGAVNFCLPNTFNTSPSDPWRNTVSGCAEITVGGPCSDYRHGAFCCAAFGASTLSPPYCVVVMPEFRYQHFAYGQLVDTDGDGMPDIADNCPFIYNVFQIDIDDDQVGDICDNCPNTYNPDQASMVDGGIGNACNCALSPLPLLGENGCPCSDGGGPLTDAGSACGLVVLDDGGLANGD